MSAPDANDRLRLRREFNRWFSHRYQDADGRFTHLPRWFKADLWDAWTASREAIPRPPVSAS